MQIQNCDKNRKKERNDNESTYLQSVLRIRDVYPGSWFLPIPDPGSRIPDPKTATKERGDKKFVVIPFYVATNFTKLKIILVLKCWRKKFGSIFKGLYNFLPKKLSLSCQTCRFGIRDPRSGIRKKPIPDPGSRGQKGTRSRIRNTVYNTFSCSIIPIWIQVTSR